jgi:hypothetical protein
MFMRVRLFLTTDLAGFGRRREQKIQQRTGTD